MNTFINQIVKIQLSQLGYLPDYPYHLISNTEMIDAFFDTHVSVVDSTIVVDSDYVNTGDFFHTYYNSDASWSADVLNYYAALHRSIQLIVGTWKYLQSASISSVIVDQEGTCCTVYADKLPDWIYSYMLQRVVGPNSSAIDIHDLLVLLDQDNMNDEFLLSTADSCYKVSSDWLSKFPNTDKRPPSVFGEMHVIKSLRLSQQGD